MELREYIQILKKNKRLFWTVVVVIVGTFLMWAFMKPVRYSTILSVHVARSGGGEAETGAYQYDNFYRLQADEQFADTLVRWLQSPRIVLDIYGKAGIGTGILSQDVLSSVFTSRRLSSQFIEVKYQTLDSETAKKIALAVESVLNTKTRELNTNVDTQNWFVVVVDEPVTQIHAVRWRVALPAVLVIGIFLGFWGVMMRHYLNNTDLYGRNTD